MVDIIGKRNPSFISIKEDMVLMKCIMDYLHNIWYIELKVKRSKTMVEHFAWVYIEQIDFGMQFTAWKLKSIVASSCLMMKKDSIVKSFRAQTIESSLEFWASILYNQAAGRTTNNYILFPMLCGIWFQGLKCQK